MLLGDMKSFLVFGSELLARATCLGQAASGHQFFQSSSCKHFSASQANTFFYYLPAVRGIEAFKPVARAGMQAGIENQNRLCRRI
jgi:hypothetical protein